MLSHSAFVRLCRARDRLRETPERAVTIDEVAREASLSTFQFIRSFDSVFGETPHQYRIRARIDRAKTLLAASDDPVTEICLEVGCSSLGTFSDLFTRRVGVPPSVYRRRARVAVGSPGLSRIGHAPGCLSLMAAAFAISKKP